MKNHKYYFVIDGNYDDLVKDILTNKSPSFYTAFVYNKENKIIDILAAMKKKDLIERINFEYFDITQKQNHPKSKINKLENIRIN